LALRQWLTRGSLLSACASLGCPPVAPAGAVITCAWQSAAGDREAPQVQELAAWLVSSTLQQWVRQVPGSFWGQTPAGTGLLLVPVHSQAQQTAQVLRNFLDAAVQALGWAGGEGDWGFRVIGPLAPGPAREVRRQLAQLGWPIS